MRGHILSMREPCNREGGRVHCMRAATSPEGNNCVRIAIENLLMSIGSSKGTTAMSVTSTCIFFSCSSLDARAVPRFLVNLRMMPHPNRIQAINSLLPSQRELSKTVAGPSTLMGVYRLGHLITKAVRSVGP